MPPEPDSYSVDSLLPTFRVWLDASGLPDALAGSGSGGAMSVSAVMPLPAGGGGMRDALTHPGAERLLEWLPNILWQQLISSTKGAQLLDEALQLLPTPSTPLRTSLLTRILLGLASLARRHISDDFLDAHERLVGNLPRLAAVWVENVNQGWLARGALVLLETLCQLIDRLVSYRRHRTLVQQLYGWLTRLVLLTMARADMAHGHRQAVNAALLERHALVFGEYNGDREFFSDLTYLLCTQVLLVPPNFAAAFKFGAPPATLSQEEFTLAPSTTASEFELRNSAMQLLSRLLSFKLGIMAELLISNRSSSSSSSGPADRKSVV